MLLFHDQVCKREAIKIMRQFTFTVGKGISKETLKCFAYKKEL